jgi:hypothetical protein
MLLGRLFYPLLSLKRVTTLLASIKKKTCPRIRLLESLLIARLLISLVLSS